MLFVYFWIFGSAENEINRDIVEVRKAYKGLGGDITLPGFVMAVGSLAAEYVFSYLPLCKQFAFP